MEGQEEKKGEGAGAGKVKRERGKDGKKEKGWPKKVFERVRNNEGSK